MHPVIMRQLAQPAQRQQQIKNTDQARKESEK